MPGSARRLLRSCAFGIGAPRRNGLVAVLLGPAGFATGPPVRSGGPVLLARQTPSRAVAAAFVMWPGLEIARPERPPRSLPPFAVPRPRLGLSPPF